MLLCKTKSKFVIFYDGHNFCPVLFFWPQYMSVVFDNGHNLCPAVQQKKYMSSALDTYLGMDTLCVHTGPNLR